MVNLDTDLKLNKPQLKVDLDREKVANIGLEVDTVGRTLETMLGGRQVTRFKRSGKQYDVIVQVADVDRSNPDDLASIYVRNDDGLMIPMSNLITVAERVAPKELNHFNKLRSATVTATLAPGYTLGDALAYLRGAAAARAARRRRRPTRRPVARVQGDRDQPLRHLPARAGLHLPGARRPSSRASSIPLIIMLTVPLSITGALLALHLTGGTLNVYSQIGLITLVGLITKHGILIVEFANQLQAQGRSKLDAVIEAAGLRLRPILMTTGAMVLGAVPLALATGAGAESRSADRLGDRRRHLVRHPVHAVRGADRVYAARAHAGPSGRGSTGSRTGAAAAGGGVAPVLARRARTPAARADRLTHWRPERWSLRAAWHELTV